MQQAIAQKIPETHMVSPLNVQPTVWTRFPNVDAVPQISKSDNACLRDMRDVLSKHGALDRFGVTLLHTHFKVEDDEMLLETTDVAARTQLIRPVKKDFYRSCPSETMMITALKLCEGELVATLYCGCSRDNKGHTGGHQSQL